MLLLPYLEAEIDRDAIYLSCGRHKVAVAAYSPWLQQRCLQVACISVHGPDRREGCGCPRCGQTILAQHRLAYASPCVPHRSSCDIAGGALLIQHMSCTCAHGSCDHSREPYQRLSETIGHGCMYTSRYLHTPHPPAPAIILRLGSLGRVAVIR